MDAARTDTRSTRVFRSGERSPERHLGKRIARGGTAWY
jgi:hypothetical protein